jgi:integrase
MAVLAVKRGTKGGRLRLVPIDTSAKRDSLDAAKALVRSEAAFLADPARTLVQNLNRLTNVMKKFGVTQEVLGVTPHGLRHEYADRTSVRRCPPPVRGGGATDRASDDRTAAGHRSSDTEKTGHSAYLGSPRTERPMSARPAGPTRNQVPRVFAPRS